MHRLDISRRQVMTIINVTPDSFFEGSRTEGGDEIRNRVREAVDAGATIIDIGGYSSRPGAADVDLEEEWRRVDFGVGIVREVAPEVVISVDTFRSEVVGRVAQKYGYFVVNDITAGEADADMFGVVARYGLPYIAMHMRGNPQSMQGLTEYVDIVEEVVSYFRERIELMRSVGIEQIILDPGFGFAKDLDQNYELLANLSSLAALGYPLLVGISRKSMIYKALDTDPSGALCGTIALNWEALRQGASILRVHDTLEAVQCVRLFERCIKI